MSFMMRDWEESRVSPVGAFDPRFSPCTFMVWIEHSVGNLQSFFSDSISIWGLETRTLRNWCISEVLVFAL